MTIMKLGCCVSAFAREGDPMGLWALPELKKAGYDYAELTITHYTEMEEEAFDRLISQVRAAGIPAETGCWLFPGSLSLYGDRGPVMNWLKKAVDHSVRLGIGVMVFGSGKARSCPDGMGWEQAFQNLASLMREAGALAAEKGVLLAVEPLNRKETNIILNQSEGARLVRAADHPNVRLLVDYYHYMQEGDALNAADIPLLVHAHCAEPVKRGYLTGMDASFRAFLDTLRQNGYDGRISVEASAPADLEGLYRFPEIMKEYRG